MIAASGAHWEGSKATKGALFRKAGSDLLQIQKIRTSYELHLNFKVDFKVGTKFGPKKIFYTNQKREGGNRNQISLNGIVSSRTSEIKC